MSRTILEDDFLGMDPSMKGPFITSAVFHLLLFTLTAVGIPFVVKDRIISNPISVEIVDIDELTQTDKISKPVPKKETPPEPEPPKQQKPSPPQMTEETPPDLAKPKPPEPVVAKPAPKKPPPKPKPPEPKKVEKPKETKDFQTLLRNLTPEDNAASQAENSDSASNPETSQISRLADRLTMSEEDALRRQLAQCWNVMAGAKYAEELVVEIRVSIRRDRTVEQAMILDQGRYNRDSHYRAAADAAMRALRNPRCSPLAVPPDKFNEWKTTIITFDPREML